MAGRVWRGYYAAWVPYMWRDRSCWDGSFTSDRKTGDDRNQQFRLARQAKGAALVSGKHGVAEGCLVKQRRLGFAGGFACWTKDRLALLVRRLVKHLLCGG